MGYLQNQAGRRVFYYTCIVVATLFGAYLLYRLTTIVVVLFAAILFASTVRPLVEQLVRLRLPRVVAILLVYAAVLGSLFGLLSLAIPPLIELTTEYAGYLSNGRVVSGINSFLQDAEETLIDFGLTETPTNVEVPQAIGENIEASLEEVADGGGSMVEQALPVAQDTLFVVSQVLLALVMSFYWLTSRERILGLLLAITPATRRHMVGNIWNDVEFTLGSYVRAQTLLSLVIGVVAYIGLVIFDVGYPLALATVSALFEFIPVVGPILGALPALLVAFSQDPATGLFIAGWYLVMQQVEGNILVPKLMERSVGINPLLVLVALVAGSTLGGVLGALLAIPVFGALQVVMRHVWLDPAVQTEPEKIDGGVVLDGELPSEEADLQIAQP